MASSKDFLTFIMEQLSAADDVSYRAMMGEYVVYYRGKVIGGVYDNRFLVKNVEPAKALMPDAPLVQPYPGAKDMILVEDVDDKQLLATLLNTLFLALPAKKQKQ